MPRIRRTGDITDELGNVTRWGTTMRKHARELRKDMTNAENILWNALKEKNLCGLSFRRQVAIDRFIVDFFCPRKRVVIEVDGGVHDSKEQKEHDAVRDAFLLDQKDVKCIVRVKNEDVLEDLPSVLTKIAKACGQSLPKKMVS